MTGVFYKYILRNRLCAHTADFMQELNSQIGDCPDGLTKRWCMQFLPEFIHFTSSLLLEGGLK